MGITDLRPRTYRNTMSSDGSTSNDWGRALGLHAVGTEAFPSVSAPRVAGPALTVAVGLGFLVVHGAHAVNDDENLASFVAGIALPIVLSLAVVAGGVWLHYSGIEDEYLPVVGAATVGGGVVLAVLSVLLVLYQYFHGVRVADTGFVIINSATVGSVVGFVVGLYDAQRRGARNRARRLNEQLSVLNRVLRHDVRHKAQLIEGSAEILARDGADADEHTATIRRQAVELAELGDDVRRIERFLQGSGGGAETVDLAVVTGKAVESVRREYPAADLRVDLPESLPVRGHTLFGVAVENVLQNAVEHDDGPSPTVTVESGRVREAGSDWVELRVADEGPGIPEAEVMMLDNGFETALDHGSGLGLWLVQWTVEAAGGHLRFETEDSEGTLVRMRLEPADGRVRGTTGRAAAGDRTTG
ncbi:hypothetical protein BRD00_14425 [Halobacteriales archaeon QS_8_69_26]|nr:MAG: hypothetical protein BRD00_14425 [Halobacteriales archaeon QS_8_69_26]